MIQTISSRLFSLLRTRIRRVFAVSALFAVALGVATPAVSAERKPGNPISFAGPAMGDPGAPRATAERIGVFATRDGLKLRLTTDLGSVRITTLAPGETPVVRYTVHIETDAPAPLGDRLLSQYALVAKSTPWGLQITGTLPPQGAHGRGAQPQFWVRFEVTVPSTYSVEVSSGAGDLETADIGGSVSLNTQGGNIRCGRIGAGSIQLAAAGHPSAQLETQGGHITVQDVAGDLTAITGGGHINAGNIAGDASLRSGGGHIHAGQIGGHAELETDGGNIAVRQAGSTVGVRTGGGQIDFGEVRGSVRAQTGGGGIRIMYVAGPMEVETSGGSICLTRVAGSVRAQTAGGTITAWINPDAASRGGSVQLAGASQLASGAGDIVVFLPRNLAATIDATVETGGKNRIQADPDLPLSIQLEGAVGGMVRATGMLNGGGALLKLRTGVGKIRLQFLDSDIALRESLMREQVERINARLSEAQSGSTPWAESPEPPEPPEETSSAWYGKLMDGIENLLRGGVHEEPGELQKRVTYSPSPAYPALARQTGIQGIVRLQVRVSKEGRVEILKILEGEPVLANAAIAAVKQWRYKKALVNKQPVNVISEVTFNFQLH